MDHEFKFGKMLAQHENGCVSRHISAIRWGCVHLKAAHGFW